MFNSFRQNIYKYFSKEEKAEAKSMHPFLNKKLMGLIKRFGSKPNSKKEVEFFFYTDEEDKANNLAIELKKMGYLIYEIAPPDSGIKDWSITGRTMEIHFDDETLSQWSEQMIELGDSCDCRFDGWGTLL